MRLCRAIRVLLCLLTVGQWKHQCQRHRWQSLRSLTTFISLEQQKKPNNSLETPPQEVSIHSSSFPHNPPCPWALSQGTNAAGTSPDTDLWPSTLLYPPQASISPFFINRNAAAMCCWGITTGFAHISLHSNLLLTPAAVVSIRAGWESLVHVYTRC